MEKILNVEGMMCAHCEARVRKALEALPSVETAEPDHETGCVKVIVSTPVADEELVSAVVKAGYSVKSVD